MRSALGKGISALISDDTVASVAAQPQAASAAPATSSLPIAQIQPNPKQPRRHFDEPALADLAASIKERGVIQPILVSELGGNQYEIIAGERRWRAAQRAGLTEIPAIVRGGTEAERFELSLIENVQREDLNPIEQAEGYLRLQQEFGMTQEKIAEVIGKDRAVIANTLRLLALPPGIRNAVAEGKLSSGHARALVSLDDETAQEALFHRIIAEQLPVRAIEQAVRAHKKASPKTIPPKAPEINQIEEDLQRALGRKVELQAAPDATKGWVRLEFYSLDDLETLLRHLKGHQPGV